MSGWDLAEKWLRSSQVWKESSRVIRASDSHCIGEVTTVLGSILASFDTVESEGRQMKQCWKELKKNKFLRETNHAQYPWSVSSAEYIDFEEGYIRTPAKINSYP